MLRIYVKNPPAPVEIVPDYYPVGYGLLYNWWAATDARGFTSAGDFVVPSVEDWETLLNYVDDIDETGQWPLAGGKLKENGTVFWATGNTSTNEYNLNIRGAGWRGINDDIVDFQEINTITRIHALNTSDLDNSYFFSSVYNITDCFIDYEDKWNGKSVRLVRPATVSELMLVDGTACAPYVGNDGKIYPTVRIGTQVWTAQNSCETKFRDGSWIPGFDGGVYTPISNATWAAATTAMCCVYDDDLTNM